MNNEPLISINISGTQTVVFYENHLTYKGALVRYKDINGMSYLMTNTKHSINFIPTHTTTSFDIKLDTEGGIYDISSSAGSFMLFESDSRKEKQEVFGKLVYVLDTLIKPLVTVNLLMKYSKDGEMAFGSITLKPDGIYKKRTWRSPDVLPWKSYYNSHLSKGSLIIYKDGSDGKKYEVFNACPMSVMNAVVMPELLTYLFQKNGTLDAATVKDLEKRKSDISAKEDNAQPSKKDGEGFCWSCGAIVEEGQKFCVHCGNKL